MSTTASDLPSPRHLVSLVAFAFAAALLVVSANILVLGRIIPALARLLPPSATSDDAFTMLVISLVTFLGLKIFDPNLR